VISSSNARAGAIAGKHAVPPRQKSRAGPYAVAPGRFAGAPKRHIDFIIPSMATIEATSIDGVAVTPEHCSGGGTY